MREDSLFKTHIDRACTIIEEAFTRLDSDMRMEEHYATVMQDALIFAANLRDEKYALQQIERLLDAKRISDIPGFRRLPAELLITTFGEDSSLATEIRQRGGDITWSTNPRMTTGAGKKLSGNIKSLPAGVSYGFIRDGQNKDWFFHKSDLASSTTWTSLREGQRVVFDDEVDARGRHRASAVENMRPT